MPNKNFDDYINDNCKYFKLTKKEYFRWYDAQGIDRDKCKEMFQGNQLELLSWIRVDIDSDSDHDIFEYYSIAYYIMYDKVFDLHKE